MTEPEHLAAMSNEPVAWLYSYKRNDEVFARAYRVNMNPRYWTETPLYAHPPVDPEGLALAERNATIARYRQALEQLASLDYDYTGPDDAGFEAMIHDIARSALA